MQKHPTQQLITSLYDLMHQYGVRNYSEVAIKLLTILVLSKQNKLPIGIKLDESLAEYKGEWLALLEALKSSKNRQIQELFSYDRCLDSLPIPFIHSSIKVLLKYRDIPLGNPAVDSIRTVISNFSDSNKSSPDFSVYNLIDDLLGHKKNKTLYAVSKASLPLCPIVSAKSDSVHYEAINIWGNMADALSIMSENSFKIAYSNYLEKPSYTTSSTDLQIFDYGIALSPMSATVPKHISNNIDSYDRFVVPTRKFETANILHLIKQCSEKVIVSVTEGILYSTMESNVRRYLVDNGMLKAVISLPSGIWTGTSVKTSLLFIEPNNNNQNVRFMDLTDDHFINKSTKRLVSLKNIDRVLQYFNSDEQTDFTKLVPVKTIQDNDYILDTARYVLDKQEKKVVSILENAKTITLDSIVSFERGLPHKTKDGDYTVLEVGASELNKIGNISTPTKEVNIAESEKNKHQSGFLQPNDIILILKGSAGKVGIVPEDVPIEGDRCWMANRSGIVLRANSDIIDAKTLYAYLCSDFGQVQLSHLIKGASIPNISLKELKTLPVIVPTPEEQEKAIAIVDKGRETQRSIQQLVSEQTTRQNELWSL